MRFHIPAFFLCILLLPGAFAATSSANYDVQYSITIGAENISSASFAQNVALGTITGVLTSSSFISNLGLLQTVRLASGQPCTVAAQCEGGFCCSNACRSSACPVAGGGSGGESAGGESGGGGGGALIVPQTEQPTLLGGIIAINPSLLKFHVALGETSTSAISIENKGKGEVDVAFQVDGVGEFLSLSSQRIENLAGGEKKEVSAMAYGKRLGAYFGTLIASTANEPNETADIIIEVESEALFDVSLAIPQQFKFLSANERPRVQITMFNLGESPTPMMVTYLIKDAKGRVYSEESEEFVVGKEMSFAHEFSAPPMPLGKYLAAIEVRYEDEFAVSSDLFSVVDKKPLSLAAPLVDRNLTFFIALLALLGIAYAGYAYSRARTKNLRKKKSRQ